MNQCKLVALCNLPKKNINSNVASNVQEYTCFTLRYCTNSVVQNQTDYMAPHANCCFDPKYRDQLTN